MRQKIQTVLRLAGLKEEEAVMYTTLLALKRATMPQLIAETQLNVMTAYRTMKRLSERGLVQSFAVNRKQSVYVPLTLQSLIRSLSAEQRTLRKLEISLRDLDPLLPYVGNFTEEHPHDVEPVELREGMDAFREEYLKIPDLCREEFLCMGSMQNYWKVAGMSDEAPEELAFRHKRFAKGIFARVFNTPCAESAAFAKRDGRELRTTKIVGSMPVRRDYLGFADQYVVHFICDSQNPRAIVIRNPELVAVYRDQFERMWNAGAGV